MSLEFRYDWREVVDLQPKGYLEMQDPEAKTVIHGPVKSISINDDDHVRIELKWAAKMGIPGTPTFWEWENSPENTKIVFPNLVIPFYFVNTGRGKRVQFGLNILYIDEVRGLNPAEVKGLEIKQES